MIYPTVLLLKILIGDIKRASTCQVGLGIVGFTLLKHFSKGFGYFTVCFPAKLDVSLSIYECQSNVFQLIFEPF